MAAKDNLIIDETQFNDAINVLGSITRLPNDSSAYDGLIIKQLASSETLSRAGASHQEHIAITGPRMEIFPSAFANLYLGCPQSDIIKELKRFFLLQVDIFLYKYNIKDFNEELSKQIFSEDCTVREMHLNVCRSRRKDANQIELSSASDANFRMVRKEMSEGDAFVFLKIKEKLEYDVLCLKKEVIDSHSEDFNRIDKKCYLKKGQTIFDPDSIIEDNKEEYISFGDNILLYGVPGCGKSYYVEQNYENKISNDQCKVRVVFHPDYTYTDFVGQLTPYVENKGQPNEKLIYKFISGPFTRILKVAETNKSEKCLLIIEELNRGNAPAIFGEIFQLLDREDDGSSKYAIYNGEIASEVYDDKDHPIKLPPNLSILATMNTADQNVFTMDTAFQRRWQMKHIPNKFAGPSLNQATRDHIATPIPGSTISWGIFATTVNEKIGETFKEFTGSDDKSLGVYFANSKDLQDKERFAEKVLKYLKDDAFKLEPTKLFNEDCNSLTKIIETFEESTGDSLKAVLDDAVYNKMLEKAEEEAKQKEAALAAQVEPDGVGTAPVVETVLDSEGVVLAPVEEVAQENHEDVFEAGDELNDGVSEPAPGVGPDNAGTAPEQSTEQ